MKEIRTFLKFGSDCRKSSNWDLSVRNSLPNCNWQFIDTLSPNHPVIWALFAHLLPFFLELGGEQEEQLLPRQGGEPG